MSIPNDDLHSASRALAVSARRLLDELACAALAPFLADWPRQLPERAQSASGLQVLRWLPALAAEATVAEHRAESCAALVQGLRQAAGTLAWRQTYTRADLDAEFLANYGWSELFGLQGPLVSEHLVCGFLLLGPRTLYPRHRHMAEEIYVPLSGTAAWQQGDGIWREKAAGTPIHHASLEPHAMRTARDPLLALYLWRGAQLSESARLEA